MLAELGFELTTIGLTARVATDLALVSLLSGYSGVSITTDASTIGSTNELPRKRRE